VGAIESSLAKLKQNQVPRSACRPWAEVCGLGRYATPACSHARMSHLSKSSPDPQRRQIIVCRSALRRPRHRRSCDYQCAVVTSCATIDGSWCRPQFTHCRRTMRAAPLVAIRAAIGSGQRYSLSGEDEQCTFSIAPAVSLLIRASVSVFLKPCLAQQARFRRSSPAGNSEVGGVSELAHVGHVFHLLWRR